jgi:hypothetical protein
VGRFGGFVAKYMGDGVLVYFGYPQAHEDDAERAVRAGLELVAAVGDLKAHAALQTRVGIATGLVVVGDLIGSGASQEQTIVGETPNLAARLQSVAEPNSVVIAESTRKLVGNLFEVEDLGSKQFKGISGPVSTWTALRPASVESRFEAMHASGLIVADLARLAYRATCSTTFGVFRMWCRHWHYIARIFCSGANRCQATQPLTANGHCLKNNSIQAPAAIQATPAARATHRPKGVSFSKRISSARSAIQSTFITPPTNKSAIRTQ